VPQRWFFLSGRKRRRSVWFLPAPVTFSPGFAAPQHRDITPRCFRNPCILRPCPVTNVFFFKFSPQHARKLVDQSRTAYLSHPFPPLSFYLSSTLISRRLPLSVLPTDTRLYVQREPPLERAGSPRPCLPFELVSGSFPTMELTVL